MPGVQVTELRRIPTPDGEVRHGLRREESDFAGFGEVYFSEVLPGHIKGWKRHRLMTMNLVVVQGTVRFLLCNDEATDEVLLSADSMIAPYGRLTVAPGLWMAFAGMGAGTNLLMNLASHSHDPAEAERAALATFAHRFPEFPWAEPAR
ncbi:WxcM-like domain-containing protein [Acidisoma sp. 7E03]